MLNGAQLNKAALNSDSGAFTNVLGQGILVNVEQDVVILGLGSVIDLEQRTGFTGVGALISLSQDVILKLVGSGSLVDLSQNTVTLAEAIFIPIEQNVQIDDPLSLFSRSGWDATLVIGNAVVEPNLIHGNIRINRIEGGAALMDVTLIPGLGTQVADLLIGKSITLDIRTVDGTFRAYTGTIDIPEIDLINKRITLRCADRREELINAQLPGVISTIGSYSQVIFPDTQGTDIVSQLGFRLSTTPEALDFDAYGNYHITPWEPKGTADFILNDSDVYYTAPKVQLLSRGRLVNKINIQFQYRYERLHHWERDFFWLSPVESNICLALQLGYTWCRRDLVASSIDSAGWPIKGDIIFDDIQGGGWYECPAILGGTSGKIAWSPVSFTGTTIPVVDGDGNPVLDADGNPTYTNRITGGTNYATILCNGASWTSSFRWAQTISETHSITVQAPQSQAQFGVVETDLSYSNTADFSAVDWENYLYYSDTVGQANTYYLNADVDRGQFNNAVSVALNVAKTTILGGHRETTVTVQRRIWPEIDLKHTVLVNTTPVVSKGKVTNITHTLNISTGEARTEVGTSLYQSQGSTSDTPLSPTAVPVDTVTLPSSLIILGNHFGVDPDTTAGSETWTGFIANSFTPGNFFPSNFTPRFVVDNPAIPDGVRDELIKGVSASYNVSIPDDTLTITF